MRRIFDLERASRALRSPAFRWFLWGRIAGSPTGPMRAVVQGWLVYNLTGSALALGWVAFARAIIMMVLSPLGGVLSDRLEKRWVMIAARGVLIVTTFGLALLLWRGVLQPWHIVVASALEGAAFSLMDPALTTITAELVDREALLSALSLAAIVESLTGILAAAGAGALIEASGPLGVYVGMGLLFIFAAYTHWRLPKGVTAPAGKASIKGDLLAGWRYLWLSPILVVLLGLAFARELFWQPYHSFMPAFASDNLHLGASGLGLLTSVGSAGALVSSVLMASLGDMRHKGWLIAGVGAAAGLAVIALLYVRAMPAPFILAALAAGLGGTADVVTRTLLQTRCEASYRARIASVMMVLHGVVSLSALPAGALADRFGVPAVVGGLAALVIVVHLLTLTRRDLRAL